MWPYGEIARERRERREKREKEKRRSMRIPRTAVETTVRSRMENSSYGSYGFVSQRTVAG
jgi:hypothetical protein